MWSRPPLYWTLNLGAIVGAVWCAVGLALALTRNLPVQGLVNGLLALLLIFLLATRLAPLHRRMALLILMTIACLGSIIDLAVSLLRLDLPRAMGDLLVIALVGTWIELSNRRSMPSPSASPSAEPPA